MSITRAKCILYVMKKLWKNHKKLLFVLVTALITVIIYGFCIEPYSLVCHNVTVPVTKLPAGEKIVIAVVSDFHLSKFKSFPEKKMFAMLDKIKPDMIFLPGDFNNRLLWRDYTPAELEEFVSRFDAPYGVWAVTGNHDHKKYVPTAAKNNYRLLQNERIDIKIRNADIQLAGVGDFKTGHSNLPDVMRNGDSSRPLILISHNPVLFYHQLNTADLTVSGHSHGGQIRPANRFFRYKYPPPGITRHKGRFLALTSGIGTSHIPVRIGVTPEIMVITLTK